MSAEGLRPTKTRLALLRAVADGAVTAHQWPDSLARREWDWSQVDQFGAGWPVGFGSRYRQVTARVRELEAAGWIRLRLHPRPRGYGS